MSVAGMARWSLRPEQAESSRLAWAFSVSLLLHVLVFSTYYTGKRFHVWENLHWPAWLQAPKMLTELLKKPQTQLPPREQEVPLLFVDVSPAQASAEPPKDAKYYSSRNSKAANPDADKETGTPKITGTQEQVVKTEDVKPNKEFVPLQPARPPAPVQPAPEPEEKAKPTVAPGDLTMAKPDPEPKKDDGNQARTRPRTIQEALARLQPASRIPGEKMKQEGGVRNRLEIASLDAKATPFGAYDAMLVEAISQRWFGLLDQRDYASDGRGKVVLQFVLHADGRITEMKVAEKTVNEVLGLICQKAVLDPAPFAPWPSDMRRVLGDTRNIQFTFYYN